MTTWVYGFESVAQAEQRFDDDWQAVRGLLGGKGANLGDMTRIGVPVPPGFTITTEACNAYLDADSTFPEDLLDQVAAALDTVESAAGKKFGDPTNPLLVSCRSGAKFSMPGMMDTVLNIGLNDAVVEGLIELTNDEHFVFDSYRRLVQMFGSVVLGVRDEPFEGVLARYRHDRDVVEDADLSAADLKAITAEFKADRANGSRAPIPRRSLRAAPTSHRSGVPFVERQTRRDYRNAAGIAHDLGHGREHPDDGVWQHGHDSRNRCGHVAQRNDGEPGLEGDFLINAQGEDVVAGIRVTKPMAELGRRMPETLREFRAIAHTLERHYRNMQDMEFTIERGTLWILQTRDGKRTAQAEVRIAVDMVEEGLIDRRRAVHARLTRAGRVLPAPQITTRGRRRC